MYRAQDGKCYEQIDTHRGKISVEVPCMETYQHLPGRVIKVNNQNGGQLFSENRPHEYGSPKCWCGVRHNNWLDDHPRPYPGLSMMDAYEEFKNRPIGMVPELGMGYARGAADPLDDPYKQLAKEIKVTDKMRKFETGATRNTDAGRPDYDGYLSPLVIERFGEYMTKHRKQADGTVRDSDNWQKGIPLAAYMKGMWRHFLHLWQRHRGYPVTDPLAAANIEEDLCALYFNVQGYLHEVLKAKQPIEKSKLETNFGSLAGGAGGFMPWYGLPKTMNPETFPFGVGKDTRVLVKFAKNPPPTGPMPANFYDWRRWDSDGDIVSYKVVR